MTKTAMIAPILLALCLTVPAVLLVPGSPALSQVPGGIHTNELAMRAYMVEVSEQLGVTCNYCHDPKNFKDDRKRAFKVAKDHMRIVDLLYNQGFEKNLKVDCRMCHQGQAKPQIKAPVVSPNPKKKEEDSAS